VAALAAVVVLLLGGAVYARHERVKQLERESAADRARHGAAGTFRTFQFEARDAVPLLVVYGHDPRKRDEGERRVRELLGWYDVLDDVDWVDRPAAALLPEADQLALRVQAAEMLMILARVGANRELDRPPGPERAEAVKALRTLIDRAEAAHRSGRSAQSVPRRHGARRPRAVPEAVRLLEVATAHDPRQFWAWFNLGVAHQGLGADAAAEGCFNACVALEPDFAPGYFNRGLARFNRKQYTPAEADFTTVLRLKPGTTDALVNRALARLALNRTADAEADVTRAIDLGAAETRLFFLRADVRERREDKAGAARRPRNWVGEGTVRRSELGGPRSGPRGLRRGRRACRLRRGVKAQPAVVPGAAEQGVRLLGEAEQAGGRDRRAGQGDRDVPGLAAIAGRSRRAAGPQGRPAPRRTATPSGASG